jgi:Ca2+-transporting ATPase
MLVCGLIDNAALRVEVSDDSSGGATHKLVGNLTDVALLVLFGKSGIDESECRSRFETVQTFPFDSRLKRMTRVCRDTKRGNLVIFTKGATEVVLPLCSSAIAEPDARGTIPLDEASRTRIMQSANAFAVRGYRVISFCLKLASDTSSSSSSSEIGKTRESAEQQLVYLGFAAILDPPRTGIRESISEAQGAGVRPVMITGDNPETARTIAEEVGISRSNDPPSTVVTGAELQSCSEERFLGASVFARTSPEDKMVIVRRYKELGRPVAMTGDGVNDALALSAADIGIAMGETGTEVAKQSADIILADDSFESIVVGIRQGRGIFQKIRSIIFFYIAVNLAEAIVYFTAEFIPGFVLLNAWQHIFILITAHSFPPFALIVDHLNRDVMREKPKEREGILSKRLLVGMFLFAITLAGAFSLVYLGALSGAIPISPENKMGYLIQTAGPGSPTWEQAKARTLLIAVALIAESLLVVSLRRLNKTIPRMLREEPRWPAWGLILFPITVLALLMYLPSIQNTLLERFGLNFELIRLAPTDWGAVLLLAIVPVALLELYKVYMRKTGKEF